MVAHSIGTLKVARNPKTLRELTLEKMREAILTGYFNPGDRLVERTLCEQLDVSRTIVREVLRHLETEGLVESGTHQGPVVAVLDAGQAAQIYEIRGLLEGHAARLCAQKASDEIIAELANINHRIQAAFKTGNFQDVLKHTTAFYSLMFEGGGLTVAWDVVQSLNARINRLRAVTISSAGRGQEAAGEMEDILRALRQRDPDAAEQASRAHVQRVAQIAAHKLQDKDARLQERGR
ncbi:MAG: GntR family transcriptional regulator [Pusillimonas sp.]